MLVVPKTSQHGSLMKYEARKFRNSGENSGDALLISERSETAQEIWGYNKIPNQFPGLRDDSSLAM
ncbi:MAG: hypothetical protein ACYTBX_05760 [Planctomycetota bacterium]